MLIGQALKRCAVNYPNKLAIRDEYDKYFQGANSYTFGQLDLAVNRLANSLLGLGLRRGDRVMVQTGTGLGHALSLLALTRAGMAIAPLDRTYMGPEIVYQVNDSGARAFIADADIYQEKLAPLRKELPQVESFITIGQSLEGCRRFEDLLREGSEEDPAVAVEENDIATLIYTSGTTGRPKGVPLTHRNWIFSACIWAAELGIHPYTRWLLLLPMHTSGGTGLTLTSVIRGCSLIICPPAAERILTLISQERITFTQFSPTLLANVIHHPKAAETDFSSLEHWFTSAAPISASLLAEGAKHLGKKFIQLYGTTETALLGTVLRPQEVALEGEGAERLASIGRACLGYRTKVLDVLGNEVGPGGEGELAISGDAVAAGYWNKPEADDFRDGWWHSGDVVRIDEQGFYYVIDRKKDMVVTGGLNVYPREVEDVIASHPAVHLVCVIGVPDAKWGEAVKAVIALKDGCRATEEEIIGFCKERMASYKKPKSVDFIEASQMPTSGGGYKILRRVLRDRYRQAAAKGDKSWGAV